MQTVDEHGKFEHAATKDTACNFATTTNLLLRSAAFHIRLKYFHVCIAFSRHSVIHKRTLAYHAELIDAFDSFTHAIAESTACELAQSTG